MNVLSQELETAHTWLQSHYQISADTAIVLGSGLGSVTDSLHHATRIPYSEIPHYPRVQVEGHAGELVHGTLHNRPLLIASGRHHFYEGYSIEQIGFPIRLFYRLGIRTLLLTNSAGCANPEFTPGEFMTISDHFPMVPWMLPREYHSIRPADVWDIDLAQDLHKQASDQGYTLRDGTYAWTTGPSYETPAEVQYLRTLGADAIGMSTVPEAVTAARLEMRVLGISCLTNYASGLTKNPLTHREVQAMAHRQRQQFVGILGLAIELL